MRKREREREGEGEERKSESKEMIDVLFNFDEWQWERKWENQKEREIERGDRATPVFYHQQLSWQAANINRMCAEEALSLLTHARVCRGQKGPKQKGIDHRYVQSGNIGGINVKQESIGMREKKEKKRKKVGERKRERKKERNIYIYI